MTKGGRTGRVLYRDRQTGLDALRKQLLPFLEIGLRCRADHGSPTCQCCFHVAKEVRLVADFLGNQLVQREAASIDVLVRSQVCVPRQRESF